MSDIGKGVLIGVSSVVGFCVFVVFSISAMESSHNQQLHLSNIEKCKSEGYYTYYNLIIKCSVISKSDLIRRSL